MNEEQKTIIEKEQEILNQEKKILEQEEKIISRLKKNTLVVSLLILLLVGGAIGGFIYFEITNGRVYIEKSEISAPIIGLAPSVAGTLSDVLVNVGDAVGANTPVAEVGNELIKTKIAGVIISTQNDIGKIFNRGEVVVSMINPEELRVVGRIEEDKGLRNVKIGQRAIFTVDAFSGREYIGTVDEISPTSRESGIVFNISDTRAQKEFDVKIRFNVSEYPELKNGMSAKIWVYK
jgi:multidrug resistance efflux pump